MNVLNARHAANVVAKADRGIAAIDSLITTRLAGNPAFPEIVDLDTGREWILDALGRDPRDGPELTVWAALWTAIGIEHDRLAGVTTYRPGEFPAMFNTSRQVILDKLDALVWAALHPVPADPFEGLASVNPF